MQGRAAQEFAARAGHSEERKRPVSLRWLMQHQRAVSACVEDLVVRQGSVCQLEQMLLKLRTGNLAGVVLKNALNTAIQQMKGKSVKIADIAEHAFALGAHHRVFQRAQRRR